jgi:hypothetical protein
MKFSLSSLTLLLLSSLSYASHYDSKEVKPEFDAPSIDHKINTEVDPWASISSDDDEDEDDKAAKLQAAHIGLILALEKINKRYEDEASRAGAAGACSGVTGADKLNSESQSDETESPTIDQRKKIFSTELAQFKINNELLDYLVEQTNDFSAKDINSIISIVISGKAPNTVLTKNDFITHIEKKRKEIQHGAVKKLLEILKPKISG